MPTDDPSTGADTSETGERGAASTPTADAEAVLFDMDGVIVDSEDYWLDFEDETLFPETLSEPYPDNDEITGMNFREIYDYLDTNYELTASRQGFVDRYNETAEEIYGEQVALMPGFHDLLDALRDRGLKVGIVSSSPPDWIRVVIDRFDLGPFDVVASADEIDGPGKPQPDVYEGAAATLGVPPERCVVIEDSENGTRSAERAGMHVVGYRTETNAEATLSA
ncbi:HAD family hydrolase, partial [Halobium palmae]